MTHNTSKPLLTVAIPTFNRADYLRLNLMHLVAEVAAVDSSLVEVIVSDNGSTDDTPGVVQEAIGAGLNIRYIRNPLDIGSDANIAQCFNEARGKYVQIMGDDDLYLPGKLQQLLETLVADDYGIVCLRSYGYEDDYQKEHPGGHGGLKVYEDIAEYLYTIGPLISFISACIINKEIQSEVDARQFCGTNLVQVNLVIKAAISSRKNAYLTSFMMACKRNNSGGYDFSVVFVERIFKILDSFVAQGLPELAIKRFADKMLLSYYPFNLLRQRLAHQGDLNAAYGRFHDRFADRALFHLWIAPILRLPYYPAIIWACVAVLIGRVAAGELRRGISFALHRFFRGFKYE